MSAARESVNSVVLLFNFIGFNFWVSFLGFVFPILFIGKFIGKIPWHHRSQYPRHQGAALSY